ncbi:AraC family transcriptional regulator [Flagellimonas sp. 389]|uniref:helix-turn-helix domain-containing protein n=1 Tax=Flagellimonas sp. 389 TaxID=2835862 RepID=UPI001BD21E7D|nr:helix-turn-helix domain-containing protein [Flagellimonas sp. 389]MBS9461328.1 AraC family transcriptional regulator [Flagellimonas sp. 389]
MSNELIIVSGIGAVQCILFILLLLLKKNKKLSDTILIFWFFTFFTHLVISIGKELNPSPSAEILLMTIGFLHGPFFFMYTKAIFDQDFTRMDVLHFMPFILFTVFRFLIQPNFEMFHQVALLFAKLISVTLYPIYILYAYNKRVLKLNVKKADGSMLNLSWIRIIAILFLISTGISVVRLSVELMVSVAYFKIWDLIRYIILVTVIGFYGLKYGMVYKPEVPYDTFSDSKKYRNSPLKKEEIIHFQKIIHTFFRENKAYLQPDFSLSALSKTLNIPKHHLSQIINSEMNSTFYDLVNSKRIEYAMLRIRESNNLTLEGLGYECGFNSKSTFFSSFKKETGKTPGQYKKEIGTD